MFSGGHPCPFRRQFCPFGGNFCLFGEFFCPLNRQNCPVGYFFLSRKLILLGENFMDISAILNTEKPKDNQIINKVNFRSAVLDIKTKTADIPRDITNRINWIVRDTILANDYTSSARTQKFSAEEQKQLIKVLAEELSGIGDSVDKAIKEYVGIFEVSGAEESNASTETCNASSETSDRDDQIESGEAAENTTNKIFNY